MICALLKSLVESSQLLRPFDAVPRYAKAQELIGNRIVYGNYVENYDVDTDPEIEATQESSDTTERQAFTITLGHHSKKNRKTLKLDLNHIIGKNVLTP